MDDNAVRELLKSRLAEVETRIAAACTRAGRSRNEVTLVAVTKTVGVEVAAQIASLGVHDLAENRPQALWSKAEKITNVHWHLIGHLQRNKIEATLPIITMIHSIDSVRLLQAVEAEATRKQKLIPVLLEVNVSGEASKQGFAAQDLESLLPKIQEMQWAQVRGFMTMAPYQAAELCRPIFRNLRELRDRLRPRFPEPHHLDHLSMGMTNDYEVAIEEGATFVRLGTVLFEGLGL